jgi:hypothetical protein
LVSQFALVKLDLEAKRLLLAIFLLLVQIICALSGQLVSDIIVLAVNPSNHLFLKVLIEILDYRV